ncbi:MAG: YhfC family glutamic-type intramembrane protease [Candidatus Methanomethylicaceae archaeon]|nr:YhfC family glutamic-type intramembrane protease [Candidatus Verstraetearchaeota archaeon]
MWSFLFPILGGFVGLILIRILGFKKFTGGEFLLGFVIFFFSMIIQSPIQQLPILSMGRNQEEIINFILTQGFGFILIISLWIGFIAGFVQSGFKYIFARNKSYSAALNIGLGFGLTEAFYIGIISSLMTVINVPIYMYGISMIERFSATIFHIGSTMFIVDMFKKRRGLLGLLIIIIIHGLIDTLAALYQIMLNQLLLIITEFSILIIGLFLTLKLYKKAIGESEESPVW